jgi:hypothetical protein
MTDSKYERKRSKQLMSEDADFECVERLEALPRAMTTQPCLDDLLGHNREASLRSSVRLTRKASRFRCYKKANIAEAFSKIRSDVNYKPTTPCCACLRHCP